MQNLDEAKNIRGKIQLLKELPPLPVMAQRILSLSDDGADIAEFGESIEMDPCLSARIIGLANAAYFGWPGGVRTVYDAIYKVLGLKLVKNLALGLILGGLFRSDKCREFSAERYWFTSVATAIMAQNLLQCMPHERRCNLDNIYLDGLLHDLGLPVLVHLFPEEMNQILSGQIDQSNRSLGEKCKDALGIDPCRAGAMLARKWHLPEDIARVIEHRDDPGYRDEYWPITLLVGCCARQAQALYIGNEAGEDPELKDPLGICEATMEQEKLAAIGKVEEIREMALMFSRSSFIDG